MVKVFIDGEAGTTGLQIRDKLAGRAGVELVGLPAELRKDAGAKRELLGQVDLTILCLPDAAAKEAAALLAAMGARAPRVIDASSAHRVAPGWVYGLPELHAEQTPQIREASRVTNPGCHATGAIAILAPLIAAGLVPADWPLSIGSITGYSGGGKTMIEAYESGRAPAFEHYALGLEHKHVPEIVKYSGLTRRPIFMPSVANFRQGMLVSVPLALDTLPGRPTAQDLIGALAAHYGEGGAVRVKAADDPSIEPESLNGTNVLEIRVFANPAHAQAAAIAKFDNLGKGASGAAVQNLEIMLGL